jgi:hypothetical protein
MSVVLPEGFRITTSLLLKSGLAFALLDIALLTFLILTIKTPAFIQLRRALSVVTALAFGAIWAWAMSCFWMSVYGYIFPAWSRWLLPLVQAILTGTIAWLATGWALRMAGPSVLTYCLIGGCWGVFGHVLALVLGIASKPPVLQGAGPGAIIFIAFFEFIFYWSVIVLLSFLGHIVWKRLSGVALGPQSSS